MKMKAGKQEIVSKELHCCRVFTFFIGREVFIFEVFYNLYTLPSKVIPSKAKGILVRIEHNNIVIARSLDDFIEYLERRLRLGERTSCDIYDDLSAWLKKHNIGL